MNGADTPWEIFDMVEELHILVCENFAPEVRAVCDRKDFADVVVQTFPARCGRPPVCLDELEVLCFQGEVSKDSVIIGSCCLANIDERKKPDSCTVDRMEQCFYLCCNHTLVDSLVSNGAYVMSSGWLAGGWQRHMDRFGFDSEQGRDFFGRSVKKLVLLDTGIFPGAPECLQDFADFVDRPCEVVPVGLDYLELRIKNYVLQWRQKELLIAQKEQQKQAADYAMALDLIGKLTHAGSEVEVSETIVELFAMLFAPTILLYVPYKKGKPGKIRGIGIDTSAESEAEQHASIPEFTTSVFTMTESGFWLQLRRHDDILGVIKIDGIQFPHYRQHYLNLALAMVDICSLAIANARTYQQLTDTARIAGKAEVATDILHNVGNVLNSINIGVERATGIVRNCATSSFPDVVTLLLAHRDNLGDFVTKDPHGMKLPDYFAEIAEVFEKEQEELQGELASLSKNVGHVKAIVRMQQSYAVAKDILERLYLEELIDEAIAIHAPQLAEEMIEVKKEYGDIGAVLTYRHKVLQILINLVINAIDAVSSAEQEHKLITVRLGKISEKRIQIEVADNGIGIAPELFSKIFGYGFTTKVSKHGFGLHSAANMAKILKGTLTASSKGTGKGAVFLLDIPVEL